MNTEQWTVNAAVICSPKCIFSLIYFFCWNLSYWRLQIWWLKTINIKNQNIHFIFYNRRTYVFSRTFYGGRINYLFFWPIEFKDPSFYTRIILLDLIDCRLLFDRTSDSSTPLYCIILIVMDLPLRRRKMAIFLDDMCQVNFPGDVVYGVLCTHELSNLDRESLRHVSLNSY